MSTAVADVPVDEDPAATLPRWEPTPFNGDPTVVPLPPMLVNVLDSLCEGKTNRAIGTDWGITEDTVKTHIKRLLRRIGARDRLHAVILVLSGAVEVRCKPHGDRSQWEPIVVSTP